jgi:hypothetical protein
MSASPTNKVQNADGSLAATAVTADEIISSPALSLRAYASGSGATLLAITLAVFGMYSSTVIVPYAFSDDYPILSMAVGQGPNPWFGRTILDAFTVNGRPLAGVLDTFFFRAAGSIDNLRFIRLVAVVGIVALALLLHWALMRSGIRRTPAALIVVLMCSVPAFQVYASWTVLFVAPYAALLGGGASVLVASTADAHWTLVADRIVGATAMLLAALLIYQPPAMFFWVFLAIALIGVRGHGRALRLVRAHVVVAVAALAIAFGLLKLGVHLVGKTAPNATRNGLTHDVAGKVHWFFEQPLYRSLNLFELTPSRWLATVVAAVAAGGIVLLLHHRAVRPLLYLGIAAVLIPLSFLPNLVVAENSVTYRPEVSISSLMALYAGLGALGLWLSVREWLRPRVSNQALMAAGGLALALSVAFVATSAFVAARNVTTLFVEPQTTELRIIRSQVAALPTGARRIAFVQPSHFGGMTKLVLGDEFGLPSSTQPWTPETSVLLILREEGRLGPSDPHPTIDLLSPDTTTYPENEPVVDVRELYRFR